MTGRGRWLVWVALVAFAGGGAGLVAQERADRMVYLPPAWGHRVVICQSFTDAKARPEIAAPGMKQEILGGKVVASGINAGGLTFAGVKDKSQLELSLPEGVGGGPLTLMMWFRLDEPMAETTSFGLMTLLGPKGHLTHYVKGKGKWRALKQPTLVFRAWGFEGIQNAVPFGGGRAWFDKGAWHHAAMTVEAGSVVSVYWDGQLRSRHALKGRQLRRGDLTGVELGPGGSPQAMTLDEVLVVDRVLSQREIARYVEETRALAERGFPVR